MSLISVFLTRINFFFFFFFIIFVSHVYSFQYKLFFNIFQSCVQCSEHYCAQCFAAFHLRGALKKHRSVPLSVSLEIQKNTVIFA